MRFGCSARLEDAIEKAKSIDLDKLESESRWRATSLPIRSSRYLLDNNVFISAVKQKWTKSMELIYHLLDSPAELFANELLIFEYEKYAKTLGTYELLTYLKTVGPTEEEIKIMEAAIK